MQIRPYLIHEYDALVALLQEVGLYDKVWESRKHIDEKISRDPSSILVATIDGELVGCVFLMEDGWNGFVWRLGVKEHYRHHGIGSQLLCEVEKILAQRGCDESSLFVQSDNHHVQDRYKKRGYVATNTYTFMYKKL